MCVCHWTTRTNLNVCLVLYVGEWKNGNQKSDSTVDFCSLTASDWEYKLLCVCSEVCSTVSKVSNKLTAHQWIFRYSTDPNEFFPASSACCVTVASTCGWNECIGCRNTDWKWNELPCNTRLRCAQSHRYKCANQHRCRLPPLCGIRAMRPKPLQTY